MPLARALLVWLVIVGTETLHGIARTLLLEPRVGDLRARQIAVFTGSLLILAIATASVRWIGAESRGQLLAIGGAWLVLTLAFEVVAGRWIAGYSWDRVAADFDPSRGGLLLFGMIVLALAPLIAARIRAVSVGKRDPGASGR